MNFIEDDTKVKNWKPEIKSEPDKCSYESVQIKKEISEKLNLNLLVKNEAIENNDLEKDTFRNKSTSNLETSIENIDVKDSHGAQVKIYIWFFYKLHRVFRNM